jgi:hypothetical protein
VAGNSDQEAFVSQLEFRNGVMNTHPGFHASTV